MTQITADVEAEVSFIKIPQFPTGDRQCDYNLLVMCVSGLNSCWVCAFPIRLREFLNVLASSVFILAVGISYDSLAHMQNSSLYHAYSEKLMAYDVICQTSLTILFLI